ncbi:MAG: hypothetical protein HY270_22945 [Deltaproteobacteria bacterium]|nr:hypothetical protein [Deltaproteobacteria bacterium]
MFIRGCILSAALMLAACSPSAPPPPATEVVAARLATLPSDPNDAQWNQAPAFSAALLPQDMVEPRLLEASTDKVEVRALTDGKRIAFRLSWVDPTVDDLPGSGRFPDGCAVQLPEKTEADVPAPQMGEPGRPVHITFWRASWQAMADGREDSIKAIYPAATVDHYPFEAAPLKDDPQAQQEMAKRYAPARAVGNDAAGPRTQPVQSLVAEGPGTIRPDADGQASGRGAHASQGWNVVIERPAPAGVAPSQRTQVAFAVWQGAHQEAGARKMRSVWVPLLIQGAQK